MISDLILKFGLSQKHTKFEKIFLMVLTNQLIYLVNVKTMRKIFSNYVSLLTAERIWFKCDLYLRFIPSINLWKICIDLRPFLKCKEGPFLRSWRSPRSNNLKIQNNENSKSKLVKTR